MLCLSRNTNRPRFANPIPKRKGSWLQICRFRQTWRLSHRGRSLYGMPFCRDGWHFGLRSEPNQPMLRSASSARCRCSTAASSMPSPTCAAAARWGAAGTTTARCSARRTRSPTSWPARQHLVSRGWTSPRRLIARGGSAGGLLMGVAVNLAPQDFGGIVAHVPFVDSLTTILDPSLPLTVTEWEEWGNPLDDPQVYAYMKAYSPYENISDRAYPPILAITSLNDTRVLYHEPAKWIARLRATAHGGPFLLKTEMVAGHGGRSGRYDAWREEAFVLAWVVTTAGASPDSTDHGSAS